MPSVTHSPLGSLFDCSWWWDDEDTDTRHFCGLEPNHEGGHVCSCGEDEK